MKFHFLVFILLLTMPVSRCSHRQSYTDNASAYTSIKDSLEQCMEQYMKKYIDEIEPVNRTDSLFVSASIEDSLEQFIYEVGPLNVDYDCPTIVEIYVRTKESRDTLISLCIQEGYCTFPPAPPGGFRDGDPRREKGMCIIKNRICCIKYINLIHFPRLINEEVLTYNPDVYEKLYNQHLLPDNTDYMISVRPSEKTYRYCGGDSIKLMFRRYGPTEELYSKGGNNEVRYP